MPIKKWVLLSFFPYYRIYCGYIYIIFKDKKSLRSHKTVEIKVFLNFFACWWKDPDPYKWLRIRSKTYGYGMLEFTRLIIFLSEVILLVCAAAGRPAVQGEGQPGPHAGRSPGGKPHPQLPVLNIKLKSLLAKNPFTVFYKYLSDLKFSFKYGTMSVFAKERCSSVLNFKKVGLLSFLSWKVGKKAESESWFTRVPADHPCSLTGLC